jgi:protein-tyrosine phosphatase
MITGFCDIHSHILPGVDDGAANLSEALQMLSIAYQEGIRCIVATPHFIADGKNVSVKELQEVFAKIEKEAYKISPNFKIYLGHELYHSQDVLSSLQRGDALTINGTKYILVEFLPRASFKDIWNNLHMYLLSGYYPILAHTERYYDLINNSELVGNMIRSGIYIQINISSLMGRNFRTSFCNKLIKKNWVHFLGTDAHGATSRAPYIKDAAETIRKKHGDKTLEMLLWSNPMAMLGNCIIKI